MEQQDSWQARYEKELVPSLFRPWSLSTVALAELQQGEHILDVACGTGVVARRALADVGPQGKVVGFDLNAGMIEVARSLPSSDAIEWVEGDALQMPFADEQFDVVLCQGGLQFMDDKVQAVREMYRVLKAGGRFVLLLFRDIQYTPGFALLAEKIAPYTDQRALTSIHTPFTLGNSEEMQHLLREVGFQHIALRHETKEIHFPSAEYFIRARLTATIVKDTITEDVVARAVQEVSAALQPYVINGELRFPMEGYFLLAYR